MKTMTSVNILIILASAMVVNGEVCKWTDPKFKNSYDLTFLRKPKE